MIRRGDDPEQIVLIALTQTTDFHIQVGPSGSCSRPDGYSGTNAMDGTTSVGLSGSSWAGRRPERSSSSVRTSFAASRCR